MPRRVIYVHDAAIDEYMAGVVLASRTDVEVAAIVIMNADCIAAPAMDTSWRILQFIGRGSTPQGLSGTRCYNAFPWQYRTDCVKADKVAALARFKGNRSWPPYPDGDRLLAAALHDGPATLIVTSPLTPVAALLEAEPRLASRIERLVWMGGAVHVPGNIDPKTVPAPAANKSAEWNAFADPYAVAKVLASDIALTICPLDLTNRAKPSATFHRRLASQAKHSSWSQLAVECYALVKNEPFYCLWDTVTVAVLLAPELFAPAKRINLGVGTSFGPQFGALVPAKKGVGRNVDVVLDFIDDGSRFMDFLLAALDH